MTGVVFCIKVEVAASTQRGQFGRQAGLQHLGQEQDHRCMAGVMLNADMQSAGI